MIHGRPDKRWAQSQSYSTEEMMQFKRNQTLVVIHANDSVVIAADRLEKKAVRRKRTGSSNPFTSGCLDRRTNGLFLLVTKDPLFAAMGIQSRNGDPGLLDSEAAPQALMG